MLTKDETEFLKRNLSRGPGECEGIDGSTEVLLMAQRELARRMENGVVWE